MGKTFRRDDELRLCLPIQIRALGALVGGCATVLSGTTRMIGLNTDPERADCQFSRTGLIVGRVYPTAGTNLVAKNCKSVAVLCRKDGFDDTTVAIGSEFQATALGNILLGGGIGLVVDAARGAMARYPEAVTLTLIPKSFERAAEVARGSRPTEIERVVC